MKYRKSDIFINFIFSTKNFFFISYYFLVIFIKKQMSQNELQFVIMPLVQPNEEEEKIDVQLIKKYLMGTLTEYPPEDRSIAWLVLSGLYPPVANNWPQKKEQLEKDYWSFVKEFGLEGWEKQRLPEHILPEDINVPNQQLMSQIHCDIVRTGRHILFFPQEKDAEIVPGETDPLAPFQGYMRRIERILYVFGLLNVGFSYIPGFNELVSPLYFVMLKATALFRNDNDVIEALTFSLLHQLITSTPLHEMYTTQDKSSIIIHKLEEFTKMINRHLPNVYKILQQLKIHPALYCYRWFNLLFAQEYEMPSLLPLWDTLFAHIDDILEWAFYVGCAQLKIVEKQLKADDFSETISVLQNLQINDIVPVIKWANHFYYVDHTKRDSSPGEFIKNLLGF